MKTAAAHLEVRASLKMKVASRWMAQKEALVVMMPRLLMATHLIPMRRCQ
jgi:hypothetical protein